MRRHDGHSILQALGSGHGHPAPSSLGAPASAGRAGQFSYYAAQGEFDECQVDKSGQWLLIKEHIQTVTGDDDNVIINLATGAQTIFYDQAGAGGHSDNGFGYMVADDNWNALPEAIRLWSFDRPFPTSEPGAPPSTTPPTGTPTSGTCHTATRRQGWRRASSTPVGGTRAG